MRAETPSGTAKLIAAATILLASERDEANPVPEDAEKLCRLFLSRGFSDRALALSAGFPPTRGLFRLLEAATLPGIIAHYWNRKHWIERRCRDAIRDGFMRVVILGAGYDTLGARLAAEFRDIRIVEIDHPATQAAKLRAAGNSLPERFEFIPLDLTKQSLPRDSGEEPTLFILEGLLMYLTETDVTRLFGEIHSLPPARARIIFSFMSEWSDGSSGFRPESRLVQSWLKWRGEPFMWALRPAVMPDFLATLGFRFIEMALTRELTALTSALDGENLVICER